MPLAIPVILIIALAVVLIGDGLVIFDRAMRYRNAPNVAALDRSSLNLPPPRPTLGLVEELGRLGFTRLGEAGLPEEAGRGPAQIWYFTDREKTTVAGVFAIGGMLGHAMVYSWFGDEAVMITGHKRGEEIDEPNFRFKVIDGTLTDAYRQHLAALPDFMMRFGKPRKLEGMAEVLRLDSHYNQRFARRRLRLSLVQSIARPAYLAYCAVVLLAIFALSMQVELPAPVLIAAVTGLLGGGALAYWLILRRAR